jgi:hypothetical protein
MPYVTLDELKSPLGIPPDDPVDDVALQLSADAASGMIDDHCGRRFDQQADGRFYSVRLGRVEVDDVATLAGLEVAVDEDGDRVHERVLAAGEYRTLPLNALARGRPIEALEELAVAPEGAGAVRVSATFGWPAVPAQVRQAALAVALRLFALRGPFGTAGSPELGAQSQAQAWAAAGVEAQLASFVRRSRAVVPDPVVA